MKCSMTTIAALVVAAFAGGLAFGQTDHGSLARQSSSEKGKSKRPRKWLPIATADPDRLHETSGIVASRKHPGVFWTHGDSGNDPKLIAIDIDGKVLSEVTVNGAPNTDWEDICVDNDGNLYIGDIGNNHAMFPARYVYRIPEPDPKNPPTDGVSSTARWRYKYPDDRRFDSESLFCDGESLYVIANLPPTAAVIYKLTEVGKGRTQLDVVAKPGLPFPTCADLSSDGSQFVMANYSTARIYDFQKFDDGTLSLSNPRTVRFPTGEGAIESVCFDGTDVIAMSESGKLYRLTQEDFKAQVQFARP